jgi:DNA-binding CsgD family transcriptional regulator
MTTDRTADGALSPELEAIAGAAHDRLHAQAGEDLSAIEEAGRRVAEAASAAIAAGARLSAIADAERDGELRARQELSAGVLRHVTRAGKRKHEADTEYEQAITRAGRFGLSHREIAAVAQVSHSTIRAILTRGSVINGQRACRRAAVCGQRTGRVRRIAAERHRRAAGTPARDLAPGAPSARRSSCAPSLSRSASHSVKS